MKRPVYTVKFMRAGFRRNQLLVFICAFITLSAIMLDAFSEVRIKNLKEAQARDESGLSDAQSAAVEKELAETRDALNHATHQLNAEKEQISNLKLKIEDLERRLAEKSRAESDAATPAPAVPLKLKPASESAPAMPPKKTPIKVLRPDTSTGAGHSTAAQALQKPEPATSDEQAASPASAAPPVMDPILQSSAGATQVPPEEHAEITPSPAQEDAPPAAAPSAESDGSESTATVEN